jgi:hypothetical protein
MFPRPRSSKLGVLTNVLSVRPGSTITASVGAFDAATIITGPAVESHPDPGAEPVTGGVLTLPEVESAFFTDGAS